MADAPLIQRLAEIEAPPFAYRHPLDENAEIRLFPSSYATPMKNTGRSLAHLAPGRNSYPQHRPLAEGEWIYILSGKGTLRLDADDHAIGPGDFAAFPAGGPAHKLTSSGTETLVYPMGGQRGAADIVDFPGQGVRMTRAGEDVSTAPLAGVAPFNFFSRSGNG